MEHHPNETKRTSFDVSKKIYSGFKRAKGSTRGPMDWDEYMSTLNDNLDNIKLNDQLKRLIRAKGIPPKLREAVHHRFSVQFWGFICN